MGDQPHPLFGGALSAVIPPSFTDISTLRDIPDNQEVFAHSQTDQSLIVELLEYQSQVADQDAARYHFEDIAGSNKAMERVLFRDPVCVKIQRRGEEHSNHSSRPFPAASFSTDILVTFNDPQNISPDSSSASSVGTHREPWTVQDFQRLLQSLTLHDPGLFG
ncbi:hypothetical protein WMY93_024890 [Mugilogobius chulae]|uniref:Ran guanine nucleotide release factor n=1 Tax=Mugilogobius chulae TaxID=88201 RepID=A0AAW0N0U6_9GOBI